MTFCPQAFVTVGRFPQRVGAANGTVNSDKQIYEYRYATADLFAAVTADDYFSAAVPKPVVGSTIRAVVGYGSSTATDFQGVDLLVSEVTSAGVVKTELFKAT